MGKPTEPVNSDDSQPLSGMECSYDLRETTDIYLQVLNPLYRIAEEREAIPVLPGA